jgi:hypothetical protein
MVKRGKGEKGKEMKTYQFSVLSSILHFSSYPLSLFPFSPSHP